jgi:ribosomal protein L11 methylase PrmA
VAALTLPRMSTEWGDYYEDTNYSSDAMAAKEAIVERMVEAFVPPGETIHDIGANTGRFSRLVAGAGRYVVSHDIDALAVERNYLRNRSERIADVLPLLLDLTNPSPSIGWALAERASTLARLRGSVVALALVHHLAISNNVPLPRLAAFFACAATTLVIEFVPKEDSQVQRLLATRADVFPHYTQAAFEAAFLDLFEVLAKEPVPGTTRTLYAMRRRS